MSLVRMACVSMLAATVSIVWSSAGARTMQDVLEASKPSDWRALDPEQTLYVEFSAGRVIIELAPQFAPRHVENIKTLVRERYFDGLEIMRVHDNYVVQWGDAEEKKSLGKARESLEPEFTRPAAGLPFTVLPDPDTYAAQTGFVDGFPAARDGADGSAWLAHCYGAVGVARGTEANSGNGAQLYVVIGHAPRQLDRNITLVGRVVQGMELLAALPRGTGELGFYEKPEQRIRLDRIRFAADVPDKERTNIEVLRTDTDTFNELVEVRRNRRDDWYKVPAGRIDVCNVPLPVRSK